MEAVLARDVERAVQLANEHISLTEQIVLDMNALPIPIEAKRRRQTAASSRERPLQENQR